MIELDIRKRLIEQLIQNKTLDHYYSNGSESLFIPDGITINEVATALVKRSSSLLNEELNEQYGLARLGKRSFSQEFIDETITKYSGVIRSICMEVCFEVDEDWISKRDFSSELDSQINTELQKRIDMFLG